MINEVIGKSCTACTACKSVCPKNAIEMTPDREGFYYPQVNSSSCIGCGLCVKSCPIITPQKNNMHEPMVYAAWNKNEEIRINSTSGGIFSALAEAVLNRGGAVVGAAYRDDFSIYHTIIQSKDEIVRLRQSKYAQSNLEDIFRQVKDLLQDNKMVLFCGSPCQSAGLQQYLKGNYDKLYCCDFICRGIISQKVYQRYLAAKSKGKRNQLVKVHFKNKDFGWNCFSTRLEYADGSSYQQDRYHDSYLRGYLNYNLYLRPCCHECRFKEIPRCSDISLGDFWGIGNYQRELDSDKGTSVVLVNSEKGRELFEWTRENIVLSQRSLDEVLAGNTCLLNVAPEGKYRNYFFDHFEEIPFDKLIARIDDLVLEITFKDRVLRFLHRAKLKLTKK